MSILMTTINDMVYRNFFTKGDTMGIFPLFTKEANEEAKRKMNPIVNKCVWADPATADQVSYKLTLDAIATIFTATKE